MQTTNEEIYHIYNRGVDKRRIFEDDDDKRRFLKTLNLFNNPQHFSASLPTVKVNSLYDKESTNYVEILCFCLMENHYHLLVKQKIEHGVPKLMHRVAGGYTKYFNLKYERSGRLFESQYKAKHVDSNKYFEWLVRYIHFNPIHSLIGKKKSIGEIRNAIDANKWSSHNIYMGREDEYPINTGHFFSILRDQNSTYEDFIFESLRLSQEN